MSVPKFFEFFTPVLRALYDGQSKSVKEIRSIVAKDMKLSIEDRALLVPSGVQPIYVNRITWALTYLKKAGLIVSPARGQHKITSSGLTAINTPGISIDLNYLERISTSFREFRYGNSDGSNTQSSDTIKTKEAEDTPEDVMNQAFREINARISDELLTAISEQSPGFFERLVVQLLVKMGYGGSFDDAGIVVGKSSDEGIDGIIREDKLGFSSIYIQAKRWDPKTTIGRPEIQKFVGALDSVYTRIVI